MLAIPRRIRKIGASRWQAELGGDVLGSRAYAEELADRYGIERPRWTRAIGPLDEPWSPPATLRMRSEAEATTPAPFRRRNLILAPSALFRSDPT